MPRFHWHVENGTGAFIPPKGMALQQESGVVHATCEIEVPGHDDTLQACFTLPASYLSSDCTRDTGVLLAHGDGVLDWQAPLATELAGTLAKAGFIVMREVRSRAPEVRRQRVLEKVLDVAATSPFARLVRRWVLAGMGGGARVSAVMGARARSVVAGQVLIAYPLAAPMPTIKGSQMPDSCMPLLRVAVPTLLVAPDSDPACPVMALRSAVRAMGSGDVRLVVAQGVDGHFKAPGQSDIAPNLITAVVSSVLDFTNAVTSGGLERCGLQRVKGPEDGPPSAAGLAALQAAQMRMQEEDALAYQQDPSSLLPADGEEQQGGEQQAQPPPTAAPQEGGAAAAGQLQQHPDQGQQQQKQVEAMGDRQQQIDEALP